MKRSELKSRTPIERLSVSQTKAKFSEVLRMAKSGRPVIVTDHGQDIVRIEAVDGLDPLHLIQPKNKFLEALLIQAPQPEKLPLRTALEILMEDRKRR